MSSIISALIFIIGLIWLAFWWMNRENSGFDERQVEAQRKAYQMGFFIEEIYFLCMLIYYTSYGEPPVSWNMLLMLGIWLPAVPVVTCMIWKDAYLKSGQSHLGYGIMGVIAGAMDLYSAVTLYHSAPDGESARPWIALMVGIFWLWIGCLMILKHFLNKREEKAE